MKIIFAMTLVLMAAACVEDKAITEISIPSHAQIYQFSYDIRQSLGIQAYGESEIMQAVWFSDGVDIVYDGSGSDNAYFRVVLINLRQKLEPFFAYEGKIFYFSRYYYYIGDDWYESYDNGTSSQIEKPALDKTALWLADGYRC